LVKLSLRRVGAALGALALLAALLYGVVQSLPRALVFGTLTNAERLKAENDVRVALIQLLAGAGLLGGLYFTARTWQLNRDFGARTLELNREGHVTDRFTKAIDQLGNENLDVRLGGIYALERIARDSPRDHEPIIDILCAFLRNHADKSKLPALDATKPPSFDRSPPDVTAALEVVGRRSQRYERRTMDLRRIRVKGAYLEGARFDGALLNGVELPWAELRHANLHGARLSDADLTFADLRHADLRDAFLDDAKLTNVRWDEAQLDGARLHGAAYDQSKLSPHQLSSALEGD
jgi:hypothetical protein